MNRELIINDRDDLDQALLVLREAVELGAHKIKLSKVIGKRTIAQNSALHLYCSMVSEKLNDAGYTQKSLVGEFKEGFELPVTEHMIKDIFREVAKAMYQKESTADLTTVEIQEVYRTVDQRLGEVTGVTVPWPSREG